MASKVQRPAERLWKVLTRPRAEFQSVYPMDYYAKVGWRLENALLTASQGGGKWSNYYGKP